MVVLRQVSVVVIVEGVIVEGGVEQLSPAIMVDYKEYSLLTLL